ncbi:MAG: hypothetical protein Q9173_004531 [Seirophora scorigena]
MKEGDRIGDEGVEFDQFVNMNKEPITPASNQRLSKARTVCTSPLRQPHTARLPSETSQRVRDSMMSVFQRIAMIEAGLAPFEDLGQGIQEALQRLFGDDLTARDMMMVESIIKTFSRVLLAEYGRHCAKGDDHHQGNECRRDSGTYSWEEQEAAATGNVNVQHDDHSAEEASSLGFPEENDNEIRVAEELGGGNVPEWSLGSGNGSS